MKVYIIVNKYDGEIQEVFLDESAAEFRLDSYDHHMIDDFRIQEYEVVE